MSLKVICLRKNRTNLSKNLQKLEGGTNYNLFRESIALIPKPDKDIIKKNLQTYSDYEYRGKNLNTM
jgi:hypothetical protein